MHRVFPSGLPPVPNQHRADLRLLVEDMLNTHGVSRHKVIETMLRDILDWQHHLLIDADVPVHLAEALPGHGTPLRPDFAFRADLSIEDDTSDDEDESDEDSSDASEESDGLQDAEESEWRLLGMVLPWGTHPLERVTGSGAGTAVDRLAALLRARDVPIGLLTDGRWWGLVWAPTGGTTGAAVWDADLFSTEPSTLDAFVAFLRRFQFLAVEPGDALPHLLRESLNRQEEVTETLGAQVRDAVEMLTARLDQLDRDSGGNLLREVDDEALYSGVVTFMMRVVFLLFAEERQLLPSDEDAYVTAYSVGYLVDQLEKRAAVSGEQALANRTAAWHRLLAVSRALFGGIAHEDLRLPAYGGEMFDPDAYPWLEGRRPGDALSMAEPPAIDDQTVLKVLRAVQYIEIDGERRRLTFRALDVEQIGYVYEGLLELQAQTAQETILSLPRPSTWPRQGKSAREKFKSDVCEASLSEVTRQRETLTETGFSVWLAERSGWDAKALGKALAAGPTPDQREALKRLVGEGSDYQALEPLLPIIRTNQLGLPAVTFAGGRYVARSSRRASSGTHYTPRRLAEEVVRHALDPLVHRPGPLETADTTAWRLRPSPEIRNLRVADIAMGSGAFLVAACRYLAEKLVLAWEYEGREDAIRAAQQRAGQRVAADSEVDAVLLGARRLVTENCLYGVDINPLAVSMAKLSLWLITMDRERPFGFLDDRIACGDSLLGLTSLAQLEALHIDPAKGRKLNDGTVDLAEEWRTQLRETADLRRSITATPAVTIRDIEHKTRLLERAQGAQQDLATIADAITGVGLTSASAKGKHQDPPFINLALAVASDGEAMAKLRAEADADLQRGQPAGAASRVPLHWPLEFPEIFVDAPQPGFDAIVGNPPFLGGQKISRPMGDDYLKWLQRWDGNAVAGSADLAARFLLRAEKLLNNRGQLGFVTTKTLVEGATAKVGIEQVSKQLRLWRARTTHPWPTKSASLQIVEVWMSRTSPSAEGTLWRDGEEVPSLGPDLEVVGTVAGRPHPLYENTGLAFQGSNILGLGFTLTDEERNDLVALNPRNAEIIQPYIIGKDLTQRPRCDASRQVINFRNWPLERAEQYPDLIEIVRRKVKPERDKKKDRQRREIWWRFTRLAPELYEAISNLENVLALSRVGNTLIPARVPTGPVFSEACVVFALEDFASLAFLSSSLHSSWVIRWTSFMRTDIRYAPSNVFETLPRPAMTQRLEELGEQLDEKRRALMLSRSWGLTTTYNNVNNSTVRDPEVRALRDLHAEIDLAVLDAYSWSDLQPDVGFHRTKIGMRWTVDRDTRFEMLDRLRVLNEERFQATQG
ncbi:hypothetical protein HUT06_42745 [Actinomadura sp. NAK00032]|uniref:Eco57I restriction-modification methylase domain-containing protein n=1 Tax=Actinomadura sp. NAK00032 TaxID=2742128 RepID=UPI00159094F4|nr:type IIL restriction-modification enzyme MmeI [Actinomadura sp. NAK00032]QKW39928.1 hypothetical protein HUT06_42745 [Actinomadura sp. NAK00032]